MSDLFREFLSKLDWPQNPNLTDIQDIPPAKALTDREKAKLTNVGTRAATMPLYPVSALAEALRYWNPEMETSDFVGTQEWAQKQMGGDPNAPENLFADFGTPDPMDFSRLARYVPELGMVLFHGSPHKWDRVDMSKIGTGEGAQAYGHGFYAAQRPGVAKDYQRRLSRNQIKKASYQGTTASERGFSWWDVVDEAALTPSGQNRAEALEDALKWMREKISYRLSGKPPDIKKPDKDALREVIIKRELDNMDEFANGRGVYDADQLDIDPENFTAEEYLEFRKAELEETIAWHQFNIDEMQREWNTFKNRLDEFDPSASKSSGGENLHLSEIINEKPFSAKEREEHLKHTLRLSKHKQDIAREKLAVVEEMNPADIGVPQRHVGYFYELEVPDEEIDKMLLWDDPIAEQESLVQMLKGDPTRIGLRGYKTADEIPISEIPDELWDELHSAGQLDLFGEGSLFSPEIDQRLVDAANEQIIRNTKMTGGDFYRRLAEAETPRDEYGQLTDWQLNQKAATQLLREAGFPGIKYRDFTRGRDSGPKTFNYVIFDEDLVDVVSRTQ